MAVRAVIFDLDNTLIVEEAHARHSVRAAAGVSTDLDPDVLEPTVLSVARAAWSEGPHHQVALDLGIASWEGLWSTFEGCHSCLDGLAAWAPGYRRRVWESVAHELGPGDDGLASALSLAYEQGQRSGHPVIAGADIAVRTAAAHCRLGLLTNGPADIQRLKLSQSGLADYFETVVISGETGIGKPAPASFQLVLDHLDVGPEDAVMVGDSWERDVRGSLAVGMQAIWIATGRPVPEHSSAVVVVDRVADLEPLLVRFACMPPG